ncbi:MAG: ISNCY family transposase, partial [bacterium]
MRKRFEVQYELGATPIEKLEIPSKSRDEMPAVLRALQYIYATPELNQQVFDILQEKVMAGKKRTGRHGMTLWEILVLATVRLARDSDYDQLHYMATTDNLIRGLLGANKFGGTRRRYPLQTIKDNVSVLDEETINRINELVVEAGHQLIKKNENLDVNIDSYVLESNVHFPTDISLLFDAARKCLELAQKLSRHTRISGWRKAKNWKNRLKASCRKVGKLSASGGRQKAERVREAALEYLGLAEALSSRLEEAMPSFEKAAETSVKKTKFFKELSYFSAHLDKHIDLVRRRLIYGEAIPHTEKLFSLFEPYTAWIKKGKAGNRPELGLPVAAARDQYGFILTHRVMQKQHDKDVAVPMGQ